MKKLFLIFIFISFSYSQQYVFLLNKYNKEVELEAKIIADIAMNSVQGNIRLFIPQISKQDKAIYSKYFELVKLCQDANFIFDKNNTSISCSHSHKVLFTNNYKRLIKNKKYHGAFFWSKSRPNIVFVKNRIQKDNIQLPMNYSQFIEDLNYE